MAQYTHKSAGVRSQTTRFLLAFGVFSAAGCVDAPITADQLSRNGELRSGNLEQSAFSAVDPTRPQAAVRIAAVLAAQPQGALEDQTTFASDIGTVHLHLRADGLLSERDVVYRWTHHDLSVLVPGTLVPTDRLTLGDSMEIGSEQLGHWEVAVLTRPLQPGEPPRVLVERSFEITAAN